MSSRERREKFAAVVILLVCLTAAWLIRDSFPGPGAPRVPTVSSERTTLLVHITGLLLIVPPKQGGDSTHVLMPQPAEKHEARLIFEAPDRPGLCAKWDKKDCFVDMEVWSLAPLGAGGTPTGSTIGDLPREVVNLTHGSGGRDRVDVSSFETRIVATFVSGRPVSDACSLATWYYDPPGLLNAKARAVANLVTWQIQLPQSRLELIFKRRQRPYDTVHVSLQATSDTMQIVLRHLPAQDPPKPGFLGRPAHFDALYDPLGIPKGDRRRTPPRYVVSLGVGLCPSAVETRLHAQAQRMGPVLGLDTYSCLVGAAERK